MPGCSSAKPELTDSHGNLVFTGVEDDPETLATLAAMGFGDAAHVSGAIRGWHHGRIRAMRSARARELLTKLTAGDPGGAGRRRPIPMRPLTQFDRFLSGLPSGVQLFSLFLARPEFLNLLARMLGLGAAAVAAIWRAIRPPWMRCWTRISCKTPAVARRA